MNVLSTVVEASSVIEAQGNAVPAVARRYLSGKQSWVTRATDSDNRRYTLATLTASGWDKVTTTHLRDIASRIQQAIDPYDGTHR